MERLKQYLHPIQYYNSLSVQAKAGIWFLVCSFLQKGMSAITTPIYTRLLTTAEYGQVSVYYSWVDILGLVITFGLSSSVYQRGLVMHEDSRERYTSSMLSLAAATTLGSLCVYLIFRQSINQMLDMSTWMILVIYVYVFFNTATEFWLQEKRVMYHIRRFVVLTVLLTLLRPLCAITAICVFPAYKVNARVISDVMVVGVCGAILLAGMIGRGKYFYDNEIWKKSMLYVLPLIPHFLSQRVLSQSDRIMIERMISDSDAGIYSLAYSVGTLMNLLTTSLDSTMAPWAYRKMKDGKYRDVGRLGEALLVFFGLCVLCFSLIAPELVRLFASADYYEAIYIVPPLAVSSYYMFMYGLFVYYEYYSGKTQFVMIATLLAAGVNLVLNFIFIRRYGYIAAAYTTLACYILYAVGHYALMRYICKKHFHTGKTFNGEKLLILSAVVTVLGIAIIVLYDHAALRLVIAGCTIAGTLVYALRTAQHFGKMRR